MLIGLSKQVKKVAHSNRDMVHAGLNGCVLCVCVLCVSVCVCVCVCMCVCALVVYVCTIILVTQCKNN